MGRINLKCKCGWNLFVSDLTQATETTCPSCYEPIPIPGRAGKAGEVLSPAQVTGEYAAQWKKVKLLSVGLGAVVVVAVVLFIVTRSGGSPKPPEAEPYSPPVVERTKPLRYTRPGKAALERALERSGAGIDEGIPDPAANPFDLPSGEASSEVTEEPPPQILKPPPPPRDYKSELALLLMKMDVGCITTEVLRHRGEKEVYESVLEKTKGLQRETTKVLGEMAEHGMILKVRTHLQPGDQIVHFDGKGMQNLPVPDRAELLERWLKTYHVGAMTRCTVERGGTTVTVNLFMPSRAPEVLRLAVEAGLLAGEASDSMSPSSGPAPNPDDLAVKKVPEEILKSIQGRLDSLPRGYVGLLPREERLRMQEVLEKGEGFYEDLAFLRKRILGEVLPCFEDEAKRFQAKVKACESEALKSTSTDVVFFKDGRKIEGKVEAESAGEIKISSRFGSVRFPRDQILRIERGAGAAGEFLGRYKAAEGKTEALADLMQWCKEKRLKQQKEYLAYLILVQDPLHEGARGVAKEPLPDVAEDSSQESFGEGLLEKLEWLAQVFKNSHNFTLILREVRFRTEGMTYSAAYEFPLEYAEVQRIIKNPLDFNPYKLHPDTSTYFGQWWHKKSFPERVEFIKAYGLWCASSRAKSPIRK